MNQSPDENLAAVDANPYAPPAETTVTPAKAERGARTTHPFLAGINATIATAAIGFALIILTEPWQYTLLSFLYGPRRGYDVNPVSMLLVTSLVVLAAGFGMIVGIRTASRRRRK